MRVPTMLASCKMRILAAKAEISTENIFCWLALFATGLTHFTQIVYHIWFLETYLWNDDFDLVLVAFRMKFEFLYTFYGRSASRTAGHYLFISVLWIVMQFSHGLSPHSYVCLQVNTTNDMRFCVALASNTDTCIGMFVEFWQLLHVVLFYSPNHFVAENMSRTFARLELTVTQNGNQIKTFAEDVAAENSHQDVSTLIDALQKTKDSSNEFLTTLVEQEKLNKPGGVVISHSKRKHCDDGKDWSGIYFQYRWFNGLMWLIDFLLLLLSRRKWEQTPDTRRHRFSWRRIRWIYSLDLLLRL